MTLSDIQNERCPRISANDLVNLLNNSEAAAVIDLRGSVEYKRAHIDGSINIPFTSVSLNDVRLEALNVDNLKNFISNKTVVIVSTFHDTAVLVRFTYAIRNGRFFFTKTSSFVAFQFSTFLLECGASRVCTLHKGFNILHSIVPNILVSS